MTNLILHFLTYFFGTLAVFAVFVFTYIKLSHYKELEQIKRGDIAPSVSFVGVMLGFLLPILVCSVYSVTVVDFTSWAVISGLLQLIVYKITYSLMGDSIEHNNVSAAIFHATISISVGLINAVSLIPMS